MMLNNLINLQKTLEFGRSAGKTPFKTAKGGTLSSPGSEYSFQSPFYGTTINLLTNQGTSTGNAMVGFGSGTTPVTADDYMLESVISSLSAIENQSKITATTTATHFERVCDLDMVIQNTSSSEITINELGFFMSCSTSWNATTPVLLYREVLETPIIIPAGLHATVKKSFTYSKAISITDSNGMLDNLVNFQKSLEFGYGHNFANAGTFKLANGTVKSTQASYATPLPFTATPSLLTNPASSIKSYSGAGIAFGTGTKPVESTDTALESICTTLSMLSNTSKVVNNSTADLISIELDISAVIKNTATEDVTLTELGLYSLYPSGYQSSYYFLIYREVLENPITIPANDSVAFKKSFTYTKEVSQPII